MQEENRHILIKGIKDMPEHKAPIGLWGNIETMMSGVPADILPVHKPFISAWDAIEAGIGRSSFFGKSFYRAASIVLLVFLIGGAAIIYFNGNNFDTPKHSEKSNSGKTITVKEDIRKEKSSISEGEKSNTSEGEKGNIGEEEKNVQHTINPLIIKLSQEEESHNYLPVFDLITLKPINAGPIINQQKKSAGSLSLNNSYLIDNDNIVINNDPFRDCNFNGPQQNFYIGPGFEYQYFMNSSIPENVKLSYWYSVDLSILFQRNRFSVETGLGVGFSKDKINFSYNYLTNELIHTYEYVDSVYYDPITGTTEYFTTTVEVYDSIPYSKQSSSETKYTYLQVPLELGYEILKNKKYALCIKAGITYFTEINRKEIYPVIYQENSRITSYNTYDINRRKEFFRISGGLEFRWEINTKLRFTAKPTFNYFLNQIYENEDNRKNPMALGIRFGLYYKL